MKCNKCGNEVPTGANFCAFCGNPAQQESFIVEPAQPRLSYENLTSGKPVKLPMDKKKKIIIIAASVIGAIILISVISAIFNSGGSSNYDYGNNAAYDNYGEDEIDDALDEYLEDEGDNDYAKDYEKAYNPTGTETLQYPSQNDTFTYDVYETYVEITGITGEDIAGEVKIPNELDNLPVRSIAAEAFGLNQRNSYGTPLGYSLTSVIIPDSVYYIGDYAFGACEDLVSVEFGKNVFEIGAGAFDDTSLKELVLPDSVKIIGEYAFHYCYLESIVLSNQLIEIPKYAFANNYELTNIEWGVNIQKIGERAFTETGLEIVAIPDSVTSIFPYAFSECNNLKKISFGNKIEWLSEGLLFGCINLEEIVIPANITSINDHIFGAVGLSYSSSMVVYGEKGSAAADFASKWGLKFVPTN